MDRQTDEEVKVALFMIITWVIMLPFALYQICECLIGLSRL